MRNSLKITLALSLIAGLASVDAATARPRHHHYRGAIYATGRGPLVVNRRSFVDSGVVVPVGSTNLYATQPAYEWIDPVSTYQRDRYMDGILHEALDPRPRGPMYGF